MSVDDLRTGTWVTYVDGKAHTLRLRRCKIEVVAGPDAGMVRELESPVIRVGARRGCDVELTDGKVSGVHFEIRLDERGYRLRDLESTNGTWVGGHRVMDMYVNPGTIVAAGGSKIRFDPLGDSVELALSEADRFGGMIGRSVKMRELFARLERIAGSEATVLVTGETGTGKELVAEAVHERSPRSEDAFVVLDCGAIQPNLVESELFGHERGAFTGAMNSYAGAFERAHGGTLFLDEIGELPLDLQPKLLRVLERKEIRRIGGAKMIPTDIRVIAATNRDLGVEVNKGRFREDLFYRLAVARVHVPPLRERKDDIPLLIDHFLQTIPGGEKMSLRRETVDLMVKHDWPGNVRELRNVIERSVLLSEAPGTEASLRRSYLPGVSPAPGSASAPPAGGAVSPAVPEGQTPSGPTDPGEVKALAFRVPINPEIPFKIAKQELTDEFERRYIRALLERHGGNISAAARAAGIDRMSIHKILNRLGMERPKGE